MHVSGWKWGLALAAWTTLGCSPTYAPPVRSPEFGAPGRTAEGDVAVAGAMVGLHAPAPTMGGPMVAYGVRDAWAVEGGADFAGAWRVGWAGVRYTHAPRRHSKHHLAVDINTAGGAGVGGQLRGNGSDGDGRSAFDRTAGGGLLGVGVGGHFSFFSIFARGRGQVSAATGVPVTGWWTAAGGVQFRIAETVDLYAQSGPSGYVNRVEDNWGVFTEFGVAVRIPTVGPFRRRR